MDESATFSYTDRGRLEKAVVGDVTITASATRDGANLRFMQGEAPFLELQLTSVDDDEGSIARTTVAAQGDNVEYRMTLDFTEEPGQALRDGKLEADVTVEIDGETVHLGVFDGTNWQVNGMEGVPTLQDVLIDRLAGRLTPLLPALRSIVAAHDEAGVGAPVPPDRGELETFGWRGRFCKWYCTAAWTATIAACCSATTPGGCIVCTAAGSIAMDECKDRC